MHFSEPHISIAVLADAKAIVALLNMSYRGESSKKGWTTEANIIAGDVRSDEASVSKLIQQKDSVFLKYTLDNQLVGCVNLQQQGKKIYLGMFSVSPGLQGGGIGKKILHASEEYALDNNIHIIYMSVISVRTELIDWYIRHGYHDTGERKTFNEDGLTGKHLRPLEFMILEKEV